MWVYPSSKSVPLPQGLPGGSFARDVSADWVVGYIIGEDFYSTPVVWNLVLEDCQSLRFYRDGVENGQAFGVNEAGQIVGWVTNSDGTPRATFWSDSSAEPLNLTPSAVWRSHTFGINSAGVAVGGSDDLPFIWDGALRFLPIQGDEVGAATAINNDNVIIGWVWNYSDGRYYAMLWWHNSAYRLEELANTPWSLAIARDINNRGQIVATGYDEVGKLYAMILSPSLEQVKVLEAFDP